MTSESGKWWIIGLVLGLLGLLDASFLLYEHLYPSIIPCTLGPIVDCGKVLNSAYAVVMGVPLAALGVIYYSLFLIVWNMRDSRFSRSVLFTLTAMGLVCSTYFVYLQAAVIGAYCLYCLGSALICLTLFFFVRWTRFTSYRYHLILLSGLVYRNVVKPLLFIADPERVHTTITRTGQFITSIIPIRMFMRFVFGYRPRRLHTVIGNQPVLSPIGLSAGFDYEARLTQALEPLGFGFQTVGTITNLPCPGNPNPRLGRLPKSRSLLVNKGFRNPGVRAVVKSLARQTFPIPVGISIGRTNIAEIATQEQAIEDIISAFKTVERNPVPFSYYELNISCPNLQGDVSFYEPSQLNKLLKRVDNLKLSRPLFIKMPIELDDDQVLRLLDEIMKHTVTGIIIGNLQKNRKNASVHEKEITLAGPGNLSGKPTEERSNQLIALSYKKVNGKLQIIGCGGVFTAADAYRKITLGASLIQMITGMIFQGPQVVAQMNMELESMLEQNGMESVREAVGLAHVMSSTD